MIDLTELGYAVTFRPYDGGHNTPGYVTDAALRHFIGMPEPAKAKR